MGHFIIALPGNKQGDVRWGKVYKKGFFLFNKNKSVYKGYVVNIIDSTIKTEYRLFKSQIGEWSKDPDSQRKLDKTDLLIRDAIIEKEKELNIN